MKNLYKMTVVNNVEMISFHKDMLEEGDKLLSPLMKYSDFVFMLEEKGYRVYLEDKDGLYYKVLEGDVSSIPYETELDAYMDCFIHAVENNRLK